MSGEYFRSWVKEQDIKPEAIAFCLGISFNTLQKKFRTKQLDKITTLALAQLGCKDPLAKHSLWPIEKLAVG